MSTKRRGPKQGRNWSNSIASRSPEWQRKEREADRAIARGDVTGPLPVERAISALHRAVRRSRGR